MFKSLKSMVNRRETPPIADKYRNLRNIIINLDPESQDIKPSNELRNVWGILIESSSRFPCLTVAVMVLADGHTSIYGSEGAAYVGIHPSPEIAEVSKYILTAAEELFSNLKPTTDFPIPHFGSVSFFIFTYSGAVMECVKEKELHEEEQPFASLYRAYHEILYRNRVLIQNNPDRMIFFNE